MKYFTKDWYELCQKTDAHLLLEEDKRAESFSEEYYQQIYNEKLTEWMVLQEKVAFLQNKPFDREKTHKQFDETFTYNQEDIMKVLPEEILKEISDIRVFVLNKACRQVINDVTRFCEKNQKSVERTMEEYQKYYKKSLKLFNKNFIKNMNFHDCKIIDIKESEQSLSIYFDNSGGFTDINELQFQNYKIIKQDSLLKNSWWLYDEIYKTKGKYELHVLLQNENRDIVEFIISAEHISFKHNQEK